MIVDNASEREAESHSKLPIDSDYPGMDACFSSLRVVRNLYACADFSSFEIPYAISRIISEGN